MAAGNLLHVLYDGRAPDSPAVRAPGGPALTTATLRERIACYAAALHRLGAAPGDRVSFKLEKSPEVIALAHACLQLGAILHPLNTAYTDEEIAFLLGDAEPRIFVCDPRERERFEPVARAMHAHLETLSAEGGSLRKKAFGEPPQAPFVEVEQDATAAILYTSGTTGKPKGAQITHRNLAESARALAQVWRLGPADVLLHTLPLYHAHGLLTAVNSLLVAGGSILSLPRFEAAEVIAALPTATLMMGVPTHYGRLLKESDLETAIAAEFRLFISGSAPLPEEIAAAFARRTGRQIIERYGSTEAAIVTAVPAGTVDRAGWVGWALPGVEIRVADPSGPVGRSGVGGLETRGHNVFRGYWRRPDADAEAFTQDGWFVTGDLAEIDHAGCVRLLGRSKDLVISGGLNVYPKEVESVLDRLPGVIESAVFGVVHPDFGEAVVAVVEVGPEANFSETAAIAAARESLAAFKTPKRIFPVREIPRNRMGKVLKADLRNQYGSLFAKREGVS